MLVDTNLKPSNIEDNKAADEDLDLDRTSATTSSRAFSPWAVWTFNFLSLPVDIIKNIF